VTFVFEAPLLGGAGYLAFAADFGLDLGLDDQIAKALKHLGAIAFLATLGIGTEVKLA
jgi:hypothetical protein